MPEQATETNEPDRCKYIYSNVWRDGFEKFLALFYRWNNPDQFHSLLMLETGEMIVFIHVDLFSFVLFISDGVVPTRWVCHFIYIVLKS